MSNGRLLLVDDEPQIRRVLRTTLSAQGYEIHDSRSAEEALLTLRDSRFDLIILDMNMPGMGGLEACRQIRATSEVLILMLTVRDTEHDKVAALDAGADDFITKPFSTPELLARIRAALRRLPTARDGGPDSLCFDDIEISLSTRRLVVRGKETRLTPKEFELLNYLLANPNIPIPHAKLLQAVWGPDYGYQVEYLRVFINQLRKKIELDPAHPQYLLTEPWVGYRFALPTLRNP